MRWWLFVLVGAISYVFFILSSLPAQQTLHWLTADDFPIAAEGVSGTLWKGSAKRTFYKGVELGTSIWEFKPLSLLLGQVKYQIDFSDKKQKLSGYTALNIITGGVIFSDFRGSIETAIIPPLVGQPFVRLDGKLDIDIQRIQVSHQQLTAAVGSLRWNDAVVLQPIKSNLGSLQFNLSGDEQMLITNIKDAEDVAGPFKVDAVVELEPDGKYRIHGKVKQRGTTDQGLVSLLQNIGRPLADGSTQIDFSGQL